MSVQQWFDLHDLGLKLETPILREGRVLRLTRTSGAFGEEVDLAKDCGWVFDDTRSIATHYKNFGHLSEVALMMEPFVDRATLIDRKKDVTSLQQGELTPAHANRSDEEFGASREALASDLFHLNPAARSRIMETVIAAQRATGTTLDKFAMFDNDALSLWRRLGDREGYETATTAMMVGIYELRQADPRHKATSDAVRDWAAGGARPDIESSRFHDKARAFVDRVKAERATYEPLSGRRDDQFWFASWVNQAGVNYRVLDGARFAAPRHEVEIPRHEVKADSTLPIAWRNDLAARFESVASRLSGMLDVRRDQLTTFPKAQTGVIQFGRQPAGALALITRTPNAHLYKFSITHAGTMAHEIGHGIDVSRKTIGAAEKYDRLLGQTGIRDAVNRMVEARGGNDSFARYLASDAEIVARCVTAALAEHDKSRGLAIEDATGGVMGCTRGFDYAPPAEMLPAFVVAMKDVISMDSRLTKQMELRQAADGRPSAPAP